VADQREGAEVVNKACFSFIGIFLHSIPASRPADQREAHSLPQTRLVFYGGVRAPFQRGGLF
jgi:hypothetical protein